MRFSLFAAAAVLVLSGCNTMSQDSYQKEQIVTPGVENVNCYLETDKQKYLVMTPRLVTIERSKLPLTVTCEKAGYYDASVVVQSHLNTPNLGLNVYNGIVPGVAVDVASHSIYAYPNPITVIMLPKPDEKPDDAAPYVLQKKVEAVTPAPVASAPPAAAADKTMSKNGRK